MFRLSRSNKKRLCSTQFRFFLTFCTKTRYVSTFSVDIFKPLFVGLRIDNFDYHDQNWMFFDFLERLFLQNLKKYSSTPHIYVSTFSVKEKRLCSTQFKYFSTFSTKIRYNSTL